MTAASELLSCDEGKEGKEEGDRSRSKKAAGRGGATASQDRDHDDAGDQFGLVAAHWLERVAVSKPVDSAIKIQQGRYEKAAAGIKRKGGPCLDEKKSAVAVARPNCGAWEEC